MATLISRLTPGAIERRRPAPDLAFEEPDASFDEQRQAFERDGYIVIDPGVPEETLDRAVADLAGEYHEERPSRLRRGPLRKYGYRDEIRISDAWRTSRAIRDIAVAPRVIGILRALYGRRPLPFQTLNFRVGTQQAAHSDTIHFNSRPSGYMCGVWVALEDIDDDNGPLVYYPGTHKLPEITPQDIGVSATFDDYARYEDHLRELIARERLEPRYGTLRKGQALVWAANLLHGGAPQRDAARTRLSQVTHYFFEGCRYWTPMESDGDHVTWREPVWVR